MKTQDYMHEATQLSAVLGRKSEVQVVFKGEGAGTDGNIIQLPSLAHDVDMTKQQVNIARGFVDHEAAHIKYTDMPLYLATVEAWKKEKRPDRGDMLNAMEDMRIEALVMQEYEGSALHFREVAEFIDKKMLDKPIETYSGYKVGAVAYTWYGRWAAGYGNVSGKLWMQVQPEIRDLIIEYYHEAKYATMVAELIDLARELADKLLTIPPTEDYEEDPETKDSPIDPGVEAATQVLKGLTDRKMGFRRYTDQYDRLIEREQIVGDLKKYKELRDECAGELNVMRRALERALMAMMNRHWDYGKHTGRLDTRRLVAAYQGREDVFKRREKSREVDTSVMLVVDQSGSMNGARIRNAAKAAIAMAESLEPTFVKTAVYGFTAGSSVRGYSKSRAYDEARVLKVKYDQAEELVTYEYKRFNDPLFMCTEALGGLVKQPMINNADSLSIQLLGRMLAREQSQRKVMVVLSDGNPETRATAIEGKHANRMHLIEVIKKLERQGIEVVGIGINTEAVKQYYRNYVVLDGAIDRGIMDKIASVILRGDRYAQAG